MRLHKPLLVASLSLASTARALPPGADPELRPGANHRVGDDSFVAAFGRAPTKRDAERLRMVTHLRHIHGWLTSRPPTRPDLADRRAQLLAFLADYIAKGTTPKNGDLPWRTPVFIDKEGTICAVGYLMERSTGRELPERIAKQHRFDFIEDIAAAMPEVRAWVADSGFTLEEIASIQPAYDAPHVEEWRSWDLVTYPPPDGPSTRYGHGTFKHGAMDGEWSTLARVGERDVVVGRGTMRHGRGTWTSFYATGKKLAEGRYANNQPDGAWQIWHRSGNLAAEGAFSSGTRTGAWRFYYDTPDKTSIAIGRFASDGSVTGRWQHFGSDGELVARSWIETPSVWRDGSLRVNGGAGSMLEVMPDADGVTHSIHQGTPGMDVEYEEYSLESFSRDGEWLYIADELEHETMYGADGAQLVHDAAGWHGLDCHWSSARKAIAKAGDVPQLHGLLSLEASRRAPKGSHADPGPTCSGAIAISTERARGLDELLAARARIRAATPATVRDLVLREEEDTDPSEDSAEANERHAKERLVASDLVRVLAGNMAMFIEWPHVDRRFDQVYATMAGRFTAHWASYSPQLRDVSRANED